MCGSVFGMCERDGYSTTGMGGAFIARWRSCARRLEYYHMLECLYICGTDVLQLLSATNNALYWAFGQRCGKRGTVVMNLDERIDAYRRVYGCASRDLQ